MSRTGPGEALEAAADAIVSDSRDWSVGDADSLTWALLVGWGCEEDHEHDDDCGGDGAMVEVSARHGWSLGLVRSIGEARAMIRRSM